MYPSKFFNLFPAFPRDNRVFVAMSFASRFDARWKNVISPAVRRVEVNGKPLEPFRVDARHVSDSILTEILSAVSRARLILADISTLGELDDVPMRNGNVMYELGLAHAVRLPEEVVLFRSDDDRLLFDVGNVRVNHYNPDDDPEAAIVLVSTAITETLREVDLKKHLAVSKLARALDYTSFCVLLDAIESSGGIAPPQIRTMGEAIASTARVSAISRLLERGALAASYTQATLENLRNMRESHPVQTMSYRATLFGRAVIEHIHATIFDLPASERELVEEYLQNHPSESRRTDANDCGSSNPMTQDTRHDKG